MYLFGEKQVLKDITFSTRFLKHQLKLLLRWGYNFMLIDTTIEPEIDLLSTTHLTS